MTALAGDLGRPLPTYLRVSGQGASLGGIDSGVSSVMGVNEQFSAYCR